MIISFYYYLQDKLSNVEEIYFIQNNSVNFQKASCTGQSDGMEPRSNVLAKPELFYKVTIKHNAYFLDDATIFKAHVCSKKNMLMSILP